MIMGNPVARLFRSWQGELPPLFFNDTDGTLGRAECINLVIARAGELGLRPGEPVLIASGRGVRFFIDLLAVWWAGGVAIPYDPASGAEVRAHMLAISGATRVLQEAYPLAAPETASDPEARPLDESDTCAFLFTSGSTGKPKAVELSVEALFGNAGSTLAVLGMKRDRLFVNIPFHFTSAICHFLACAHSESTLLGYEQKLLYRDFVAGVAQARPTAIGGAPVQFRWLSDALSEGDAPWVSELRFVMSSGDHFPESVIAALRHCAPGLEVFTVYGLTEVGGRFCILRPEWQAVVPGSVGRPIEGLSVRILEQDGDRELGPGEVGEVVIRGRFLAKGYFNNPDATASTFTAQGLRTGDLGHMDQDGFLFLQGRSDDVFKVNGAKVSGVLITQALMQTGYFADAAVVAVSIAPYGTVPVAAVVLKPGGQLEKGPVRKALRQLLPGNHMPHDLIILNQIPRTGSGKAQKGELKKLLGF
jgi:acyl-CoA synthetase (AMP-forming)/AMP-acid ligase II